MKTQKIKYTTIIGFAAICLCFSAVAIAKDLHVPSEYNTIQAAIDAAFPVERAAGSLKAEITSWQHALQ